MKQTALFGKLLNTPRGFIFFVLVFFSIVFFVLAVFSLGSIEASTVTVRDAGGKFELEITPEEVEAIKEIDEEKLGELTQKEQEISQELFNLQREIETLKEEKQLIDEKKKETKKELEKTEEKRKEREKKLAQIEEDVSRVFSYLQRTGPLSYVEQLFSAGDLGEFLKRLNILRDVFSNINEIFSEFVSAREEVLALEKEILTELEELSSLEDELEVKISSLEDREEEQSELLTRVEGQLEEFTAYMEALERTWLEKTRPLLLSLTDHLEGLLSEGEVSQDKVDIGGSILNPRVELTQKNFNSFFEEREELPHMYFDFSAHEMVTMHVPPANMVFRGEIVPAGDSELSFEIEKARFFDIYLDESTVRELNQEVYIGFDFGPLMGNYRIEEVEIEDDKLVIDVRSIFF